MDAANWIAISAPTLTVLGAILYFNKKEMTNTVKEQRIKDLERELDKRDDKILYLEKRIDEKNDAILRLK